MLVSSVIYEFDCASYSPRGPRWGLAGRGIRHFLSAVFVIGSKIDAKFGIQISAEFYLCMIVGLAPRVLFEDDAKYLKLLSLSNIG